MTASIVDRVTGLWTWIIRLTSEMIENRRNTIVFSKVFIASLAVLSVGQAVGATIRALSPSLSDVSTAVASAVDGDIVAIPPGTTVWTNSLQIAKAITLQGNGIGHTIVIDQLAENSPLIAVEALPGKSYRITGLEFRNGTRTASYSAGIIHFTGSSSAVRVDHCKFFQLRNISIRVQEYVRGVVDHNEFTSDDGTQLIWIWHQSWAGGVWGDKSWSEEIDWGGPDALYIEDNSFTGKGVIAGATDTYAGARFVFRHNSLTNATVATHGSGDGAGRNRGLRHWEIYNNSWSADPPTVKNAIHIRGGTGVCFSNVISSGVSKFLTLHTYRLYQSFRKFERADGTSLWDRNDPVGVYLAGTAGAGSEDRKLVVPNAGWTTDQWKGFTIRVPSSSLHPDGFFHSIILANTSDTITVKGGTQIIEKPFVSGERFEIRRVLLPFDGTGAGTSDLLVDQSNDPQPAFLNQKIDPVYVWGNTMHGVVNGGIATGDPAIVEGTHYFNNVSRPGYAPLIYPHPLVTGTTSEPSAPTSPSGLRVVSAQ